ncbi:MAG TPA: crossover junction endodeoxyribonuclease RuvC [Nitrospirota bacterium]
MKILGIDPGTVTSGFGVVEVVGHEIRYVDCGGICTPSGMDFPKRLKLIYEGLTGVIERHRPDAVAVESVFFAKNVQSALKLGHARGVALLAVINAGLPVSEYSPTEIKQAVVGFGLADKEQVLRMVMALLSLREAPRPLDASDALAIAICHIHSAKMKKTMSRVEAAAGKPVVVKDIRNRQKI